MAQLALTALFNDANLQEYYKLEDTSGKNGNTLTNNGTTPFNAAKFNNGADGGTTNTTKYLRVASALGYNNTAYSISLWVKLNTEIAANTYCFAELVHAGTGTTLVIDYNYNGGSRQIEVYHLRLGIASGNVTAIQSLGTSVWHHMVLTWDATTVKGYIDGASFGTPANDAGTGSGGTSGLTILDQRTAGSSPASAIIDDVGLFNRVLTAAEVSTLYKDAGAGFFAFM